MNVSTNIQQISGILLMIFTVPHILGKIGIMLPPKMIHAILPPVIKKYKAHFGAGCSKALSCQIVCPMGIETIISIMRMNRK